MRTRSSWSSHAHPSKDYRGSRRRLRRLRPSNEHVVGDSGSSCCGCSSCCCLSSRGWRAATLATRQALDRQSNGLTLSSLVETPERGTDCCMAPSVAHDLIPHRGKRLKCATTAPRPNEPSSAGWLMSRRNDRPHGRLSCGGFSDRAGRLGVSPCTCRRGSTSGSLTVKTFAERSSVRTRQLFPGKPKSGKPSYRPQDGPTYRGRVATSAFPDSIARHGPVGPAIQHHHNEQPVNRFERVLGEVEPDRRQSGGNGQRPRHTEQHQTKRRSLASYGHG